MMQRTESHEQLLATEKLIDELQYLASINNWVMQPGWHKTAWWKDMLEDKTRFRVQFRRAWNLVETLAGWVMKYRIPGLPTDAFRHTSPIIANETHAGNILWILSSYWSVEENLKKLVCMGSNLISSYVRDDDVFNPFAGTSGLQNFSFSIKHKI